MTTIESGSGRDVDVRVLDAPPFDAIVAALGELDRGETVAVHTRAAPIPLYDALEERGWAFETERTGPDAWRICITAARIADAEAASDRRRRPRVDRLPEPPNP